jgi:hypothetical protein
MKTSLAIVVCLLVFFIAACKKEADKGVVTTIKGHVADTIRSINISSYKMVLVKTWSECANWECWTPSEEIATVYTDANGDYSLTFNYKLKEGESYAFAEQYYGIPYYHEYTSPGSIIPGTNNIQNLFVWKPVELTININVLNNNYPPLVVGNILASNSRALFNTESVHQQNVNTTVTLRARPNTDIQIFFYYCTDQFHCADMHRKFLPYRTSLNDVTLNYTVDCSTF